MYKIGVVARKSKLKIPTIRYYEQIGLLNNPARGEGNHRLYSIEHLKRLIFIKKGRELGFSQNQIKAMLGLNKEDNPSCSKINTLTQKHLLLVRKKIVELQEIERTLEELSRDCSSDNEDICPIIDSLYCEAEQK